MAFADFLVLGSGEKVCLLSQRRITRKESRMFLEVQLPDYLLRSCSKLCSVLCVGVTKPKHATSWPLKNSVWLRTGLGRIKGMEKFFGNTIDAEMGSLYGKNLFWKVVGTWEYQIPLIKSVGGERALQVHNCSRCEFPGGYKENEVRGEGWVQTVKDTRQVLFKHVNSYAYIA